MDLEIYPVVIDTIRLMQLEIGMLKKRSASLGDQIERAAQSVALNLSEGTYSRGGNKKVRYHSALGSAREVLACVEVGVAFGYLPMVRPEVQQRMDRILGTLVRLSR